MMVMKWDLLVTASMGLAAVIVVAMSLSFSQPGPKRPDVTVVPCDTEWCKRARRFDVEMAEMKWFFQRMEHRLTYRQEGPPAAVSISVVVATFFFSLLLTRMWRGDHSTFCCCSGKQEDDTDGLKTAEEVYDVYAIDAVTLEWVPFR